MQQLKSFWCDWIKGEENACDIAARTVEARDKSVFDRVTAPG